ncbi:MAG: glycosyltransferase [Sphingomonadales bacterium]
MSAPVTISVVIPTYNGLARLTTTIASVLAQTSPATEIIVVDDGSTDDTPRIQEIYGDRILYKRVENGGQQRARNIGVAMATGEWIALLDHDDQFEPEYLAEVRALIDAYPNVDATISNSRTWQEAGHWEHASKFTDHAPVGYWEAVGAKPNDRWSILDRYDYVRYLDFHPAQTSMFVVKSAVYEAIGGFDERMRGSGAENFEFEMRLLRIAPVGLIWQPLVRMIRHTSNLSLDGNRMAMDVVDCLQFAAREHGLDEREQAIVAAEIQSRLPHAISGAFALQDFKALRRYEALALGDLPWKLRLKSAIGQLPQPLARRLATTLTS